MFKGLVFPSKSLLRQGSHFQQSGEMMFYARQRELDGETCTFILSLLHLTPGHQKQGVVKMSNFSHVIDLVSFFLKKEKEGATVKQHVFSSLPALPPPLRICVKVKAPAVSCVPCRPPTSHHRQTLRSRCFCR